MAISCCPDTGEHLTKQRFDELHNSSTTQWVLIFANTQEMVDKVIPHPLVMIASDGAEGHPRNAGTYSRVLAQYVREKGTVTLMDAIRKMSLMPARDAGAVDAGGAAERQIAGRR